MMMKIYYSGSVSAGLEKDRELPKQIVKLCQAKGAKVLSEHVAYAGDQATMDELFTKNSGQDIVALRQDTEKLQKFTRQQDLEWVDGCTHFVAVLNVPSWGVGMEIERCLLRPARGLPEAKMLLLRSTEANQQGRLSFLISGIDSAEFPNCQLVTYDSNEVALEAVRQFMQS